MKPGVVRSSRGMRISVVVAALFHTVKSVLGVKPLAELALKVIPCLVGRMMQGCS